MDIDQMQWRGEMNLPLDKERNLPNKINEIHLIASGKSPPPIFAQEGVNIDKSRLN